MRQFAPTGEATTGRQHAIVWINLNPHLPSAHGVWGSGMMPTWARANCSTSVSSLQSMKRTGASPASNRRAPMARICTLRPFANAASSPITDCRYGVVVGEPIHPIEKHVGSGSVGADG